MILYVFLAACVALDPGTSMTRCPKVQQESFATQVGCAARAAEIMKDKSKRAVCVKEGAK